MFAHILFLYQPYLLFLSTSLCLILSHYFCLFCICSFFTISFIYPRSDDCSFFLVSLFFLMFQFYLAPALVRSKNKKCYMELIKVLWAGIDLEPSIVKFGTFAVGSSEEPSKVPIYRFVLEPNSFFSKKCIWFLEEPF